MNQQSAGGPLRAPLPTVTDLNRPFWDGTKDRLLRVQHCSVCAQLQYPINPLCTNCLSADLEWVSLSGRGSVFATMVYHHAFIPALKGQLPYNVSLIQLDEGPRLWSNVTDVAPDGPAVGDRVEVWYEEIDEGIVLPRFRPAKSVFPS